MTTLRLRNHQGQIKHLSKAGEIFKKLGIQSFVDSVSGKIRELKDPKLEKKPVSENLRQNSVVSQLLMMRLAEATASRELLFRELVAVLRQESQARKIIIAEQNENNKLWPFIAHGYSPEDSADLVTKFDRAQQKGEEKSFNRTKNLAVFPLACIQRKTGVLTDTAARRCRVK